mmetsp:Transcript_8499/g.29775  ORF Transcript_8499/g.29775 Transcript_8499/m.29775 type:complete len:322 (+) Transcript_8499:667-1632(+)
MKVHRLAVRSSPPSRRAPSAPSSSAVTFTSLRTTVRKKPPRVAASVTLAYAATVSARSPRAPGFSVTKRLNRMGRKFLLKRASASRFASATAASWPAGASALSSSSSSSPPPPRATARFWRTSVRRVVSTAGRSSGLDVSAAPSSRAMAGNASLTSHAQFAREGSAPHTAASSISARRASALPPRSPAAAAARPAHLSASGLSPRWNHASLAPFRCCLSTGRSHILPGSSAPSSPGAPPAASSASSVAAGSRGRAASTASGPMVRTAAPMAAASCGAHASLGASPISPTAARTPPATGPAAGPRRSNSTPATGRTHGHARA